MTVHLHGRFGNTSNRPYIEALIVLPRLKLRGNISFIIDSGADKTMIMPDDGQRLAIDYAALSNQQICGGVGGQFTAYDESALILFSEPGKRVFIYNRTISILPQSLGVRGTPSLLGRDVLDKWRWDYCGMKKSLSFEVIEADQTIDINQPTP